MLMVSDQPLQSPIQLDGVVRRFCAILGDDPDDCRDWGVPNLEVNREYLIAAINTLRECGYALCAVDGPAARPVPDPDQLELPFDPVNLVRLDAWRLRTWNS